MSRRRLRGWRFRGFRTAGATEPAPAVRAGVRAGRASAAPRAPAARSDARRRARVVRVRVVHHLDHLAVAERGQVGDELGRLAVVGSSGA